MLGFMKITKDDHKKSSINQVILEKLEIAFEQYEGGEISINEYIENVASLEEYLQDCRPRWRRMLGVSGALGGLHRMEREARLEASAALAWCRDWALRQRESEVTSCLAGAAESARHEPAGHGLLAA
jgi:hypothetical protein